MDKGTDGLDLVSSLPTAELSRLRRRIAFLEAAMVQLLREDHQLREWYAAGELAALRLPGLPATASGIARQARREEWESRIVMERGRERVQFHFSALPRAAFSDFIGLVLRSADQRVPADDGAAPPARTPDDKMPDMSGAAVAPPAAPPSNETPQWVLPLVRLLRGGAPSLEDALRELPKGWPPGTPCPSPAEARATLRALGLLAG